MRPTLAQRRDDPIRRQVFAQLGHRTHEPLERQRALGDVPIRRSPSRAACRSMRSGVPRKTGIRLKGRRATVPHDVLPRRLHVSIVKRVAGHHEIARGSQAEVSARCSRCCSSGSSSPPSRLSAISRSISSGEWRCRWPLLARAEEARSTNDDVPLSTAMNGRKTDRATTHRQHRGERDFRRILERERLRHEFAEDELYGREAESSTTAAADRRGGGSRPNHGPSARLSVEAQRGLRVRARASGSRP